VVHHGGAGTTSAGLRAGLPTLVCPFFGDQHFWAEMVFRAGVGPRGRPVSQLDPPGLAEAFATLRDPDTVKRAAALGSVMSAEEGVACGVSSFERRLPLPDMLCELSLFLSPGALGSKKLKLARVFCSNCGLKMGCEEDGAVHREGGGREGHLRAPFRPCRWGVAPPQGLAEGLQQGLGAAACEVAGGLYDLFAKPVQGAFKGGAVGYAEVGHSCPFLSV